MMSTSSSPRQAMVDALLRLCKRLAKPISFDGSGSLETQIDSGSVVDEGEPGQGQ